MAAVTVLQSSCLLIKWLYVKILPSWFTPIMGTAIIFFHPCPFLPFLLCCSPTLVFQIQARLQNLGSNLQNKSNDIEVLAVSHLFVYPVFIPPNPSSPFFCSPTLSLEFMCEITERGKALLIARTANINRRSPFIVICPTLKSPAGGKRWLWIHSSRYRTMNTKQKAASKRVISGDVNGCHIEFVCGCVVDLWPDILKVNQPCLSYLPCRCIFQIHLSSLLGSGLHQWRNTSYWNVTGIITLIPVSSRTGL